MTPEVTLWPPHAHIYTCTLTNVPRHREKQGRGKERMEVEKKERRGREEVY